MQIKLTLCPEAPYSIPLNYNYQVQSAIYRLLESHPDYSAFLHDTGYGLGAARFRLFTFGKIKGDCSISNGRMNITGKIYLELRSISDEFCKILKAALVRSEKLRLSDAYLDIRMIESENREITEERLYIITSSPIVARFCDDSGKTFYYSPADAEFEKLLLENLRQKYSVFCEAPLDDRFSIKADTMRKVVTRYKDIWITAYHGKFHLEGSRTLLNLAYQTGLGSRSSQGFGMFDII